MKELILPSNTCSFCIIAHAWNIALKQGGSLLIELRKSPEMIDGSEKGSNIHPFADLDKDKDQAEETWAPWLQSMCAKA